MKLPVSIIVILLINILNTIVAHGQRTITGRVLDIETKKPISNVNLVIKGTTNGGVTNHLGFFQLELQNADTVLVCSHVAYEIADVSIPKQDKFLFHLTPSTTVLTTLDISGFTDDMKYEIKEEPPSDPSSILELPARFKGGEEAIFNYLGENLKLPDSGYVNVHGVVKITFTVDKSGRTGKIATEGDTLNGVGTQLSRLIATMPEWIPAAQRGAPVDQRFQVSVKYSNEVFLVVEQAADFPGGMQEFVNYLDKNLMYPPFAREKGIEGKVFVEFVITKTGKIDPESVKAIKGLGYGLDDEAVRLVKGSPDWIPGAQRGQPVPQKMVFPVTFNL